MRKVLFRLFVFGIILMLIGCENSSIYEKEYVKYMSYLVDEVKNEDFFTISIDNGILIFQDKDFNEIKRKVVLYKGRTFKVITITKEDEVIFFIEGGAVDDNYGALYSEKKITEISGTKYIKRISSNLYIYSTMSK